VTAQVAYTREFIPLVNDEDLTQEVLEASRSAFSAEHVREIEEPITASEDFAHFLTKVPGCFFYLGNGEGSAPLHNPNFDFDDASLVHGVKAHAAIARRRLPVDGPLV